MFSYHIVLNHIKKEYGGTEPHYSERIEADIQILKSRFGEDIIAFYSTDIQNLNADLEIEKHRGYVESHYINWI